jgi:hypothetical protein
MDQKTIERIIDIKIASAKRSLSAFRTTRRYDPVTDINSPITGSSQQIGFFNTPKVPQPATGGAASSFTANSGTAINTASTFDGYTIAQVVKALRNLGLLT